MSYDNYGSQNGDNSLNVGVGDFRGANVNITGLGRPVFTPEQLVIERHQKLGGRIVKSQNLSVFGVVTGVASIIGVCFTLFQAFSQSKYSLWFPLFLFLFGLAILCVIVAVVLERKKFEHILFRKYYLESGTKGGLYLSSFTATCPWCSSKMNLRNVGPKDGPRDDQFICERNPRQHTIDLDPTLLSEIYEQ